jgi:uncharacterized membrane protein
MNAGVLPAAAAVTMPPVLLFHVAAGTVAVLAGALALCSAKGSRLHRGTGLGVALWIAVASLVLGQARKVPAAIREAHLLPVPVLIVAAAVVFWLCKVRFESAYATPRGKEFA